MSSKENNSDNIQKLIDFINQSPFYRHLNMKLVEFTEKGCRMEMALGDEHNNAYGVAHGGSIASMADSTCGLSLLTAIEGDERIATQTLVVNYLRPAEKGVLTGNGWIVHRGRSSAVLEADIFNEAGEMVAHAQTTHAIRKRK